jgi:hypothetical protein
MGDESAFFRHLNDLLCRLFFFMARAVSWPGHARAGREDDYYAFRLRENQPEPTRPGNRPPLDPAGPFGVE